MGGGGVSPVLALSLVLTPGSLMHRFTLILWQPELSQAQSESDIAAIESQQSAQDLIKKAVSYTLAHPILGVGPGQFRERGLGRRTPGRQGFSSLGHA